MYRLLRRALEKQARAKRVANLTRYMYKQGQMQSMPGMQNLQDAGDDSVQQALAMFNKVMGLQREPVGTPAIGAQPLQLGHSPYTVKDMPNTSAFPPAYSYTKNPLLDMGIGAIGAWKGLRPLDTRNPYVQAQHTIQIPGARQLQDQMGHNRRSGFNTAMYNMADWDLLAAQNPLFTDPSSGQRRQWFNKSKWPGFLHAVSNVLPGQGVYKGMRSLGQGFSQLGNQFLNRGETHTLV